MTITIEPLTVDDVQEKCQVQAASFCHHPRMKALWPRGTNAAFYAFKESLEYEDLEDMNVKLFKAVDSENGRLLATADWTFAMSEQANAKKIPTSSDAEPPANWPEGGNWAMRLWYKINGERLIKKYLGDKPHIMLNFLTVLPEAQGRGIGRQLLSWGIQEADRLHVPVVLESTPAGFELYKKLGFKEVEIISADMRDFGWTESYEASAAIRIFMIRDAL